jgi:hypothetical protein
VLRNLKKKNLLVICNDAGGANLIFFFLKEKKLKYNYFLEGPAKKIFKTNLPNNNRNLKALINKADIIFLGSGKGNLEYKALKIANFHKKYTVVFLDNWVNFKIRFDRKNNFLLPNEIWVFDEYAHILAKKTFNKKVIIKRKKNYFFEFLKKKKKKIINKNKIIYFSSNYDNFKKFSGLNKNFDIKIFKNFLEKVNIVKNILNLKKLKIDILPHPSENTIKYYYISKKYLNFVKILYKKKLVNIIRNYNYAASTNSYALYIAKKLGLVTFNNIKKTGIRNSVPHNYTDYII